MPDRVFLDTEFSSLRWGESRLISLALVAESGDREFYLEMPAHTWRWRPSAFVVETVEPLLWGGSFEATDAADFCCRVRAFLAGFEVCEIVTDAPTWDMEHLRLALDVDGAPWPANVKAEAVVFQVSESPSRVTLENEREIAAQDAYLAFFREPGVFRHHALQDARALRAAWLAWQGS